VALAQEAVVPAERTHGLINRPFGWVWVGSVLSTVGDGFATVALGLWVLQATGSATAMSMIMLVRSVVIILWGPIAGGLADRFDRRSLMLLGDGGRAILFGLLAAGMGAHPYSLPVIALILAGCSFLTGLFDPAIQSSTIMLVGPAQVGRANSLLQLGRMTAAIGGPILGGLAAGLGGAGLCMWINAASFLVSGLCILLAGRIPSPPVGEAAPKLTSLLKEGMAYLRQQRLVFTFTFILGPALLFAQAAFTVLYPALMVMGWKVSGLAFGIGQASFALGSVAGLLLLMRRADKIRQRGRAFGIAVILSGLCMAAAGLSPWAYAAFPLILVMGVLMSLANLSMQMAFQTQVPPEMQGRVFGVVQTAFTISTPLALAVVGPLADGFGVAPVTAGAGVLFGLAGVLALGLPAVRGYH
jgi:DHA3 family macrolide efflux protein-like MFS transporter